MIPIGVTLTNQDQGGKWTMQWTSIFIYLDCFLTLEVYHGDPKGDAAEVQAYDQGVREGAFGLLLNSVVLGIGSFFIEPMCRWFGPRVVWATSNFIVCIYMAGTALISLVSVRGSEGLEHVVVANAATKIASLIVFCLLGIPLAFRLRRTGPYSVPFSVTAELTADSGGGQGASIMVYIQVNENGKRMRSNKETWSFLHFIGSLLEGNINALKS